MILIAHLRIEKYNFSLPVGDSLKVFILGGGREKLSGRFEISNFKSKK